MTGQERHLRIPVPDKKPEGMDESNWCKIKKRGWWCPNYVNSHITLSLKCEQSTVEKQKTGPQRTINYHGPDYLTVVVEDFESFFAWTLKQALKQSQLTWDYIAHLYPWLSKQDVIHEGIVRALEVRSDPRGKDNWRFFASIAQNHQRHYLRSLMREKDQQYLADLEKEGQLYA